MYDKSIPFEVTVKWARKETRDTASYALKIRNKAIQKSYRFMPGQFNMLYMPGIGEAPISISSAPGDHDLMHTIRMAGDVTTALSKLKYGDVLGMRGPFGNGWPLHEIADNNLIIISGGVGIAPLRSVLRHILGERSGSPAKKHSARHTLLYGAKTPKDIVFKNEFPRYREAFDIFLSVDKADPEVYWRGDVGLVTSLLSKVTFNPSRTIVFLCGPEVMMQNVVHELLKRGLTEDKIFLSVERNMNCGMGLCGHCFLGPRFVCKDGPVFRFSDIGEFFRTREI